MKIEHSKGQSIIRLSRPSQSKPSTLVIPAPRIQTDILYRPEQNEALAQCFGRHWNGKGVCLLGDGTERGAKNFPAALKKAGLAFETTQVRKTMLYWIRKRGSPPLRKQLASAGRAALRFVRGD